MSRRFERQSKPTRRQQPVQSGGRRSRQDSERFRRCDRYDRESRGKNEAHRVKECERAHQGAPQVFESREPEPAASVCTAETDNRDARPPEGFQASDSFGNEPHRGFQGADPGRYGPLGRRHRISTNLSANTDSRGRDKRDREEAGNYATQLEESSLKRLKGSRSNAQGYSRTLTSDASRREFDLRDLGQHHAVPNSLARSQLEEQPAARCMPQEIVLPPPPPRFLPQETALPPPPPRAPINPQLDFFSEQFDAKLALATRGLLLPNPRVRPLQMLQQCRFILPLEMPESLANFEVPEKTEDFEEGLKARTGPVAKRRMAEELRQSAVGRIAEGVFKGPLLLLKRCYQDAARVRIVTRHARGVRGTATGVLKAFDKQMNLVLQDVEEHYTVRLKIQRTKPVLKHRSKLPQKLLEELDGPADLPEYILVDSTRSAFKQEHRSRNLKQIFLRGSNIVMVSRGLEQSVSASL